MGKGGENAIGHVGKPSFVKKDLFQNNFVNGDGGGLRCCKNDFSPQNVKKTWLEKHLEK